MAADANMSLQLHWRLGLTLGFVPGLSHPTRAPQLPQQHSQERGSKLVIVALAMLPSEEGHSRTSPLTEKKA